MKGRGKNEGRKRGWGGEEGAAEVNWMRVKIDKSSYFKGKGRGVGKGVKNKKGRGVAKVFINEKIKEKRRSNEEKVGKDGGLEKY